jgi:hypothetical protein
MAAIVVSAIAFFVAAFFIKRQVERMDLPKGMTSNTLVFALALLVSYFVATLVDWAVAR